MGATLQFCSSSVASNVALTMKLIYFDMQGRAEFSRLLLAQAGVQYEDKRISQAEWEKMKPSMPFAELPALEVDGQTIVQSLAIARYIAKKHGLAGQGDMEAAKADMIVDGCSDFINKVVFPLHFEKDAGKKAALKEKMKTETFPKFLTQVGKVLNDNGGKFLVGGGITYADICVGSILHGVSKKFPDVWSQVSAKAPKLAAHMEMVFAQPNIKKWVESRPKNEN